MSNSLPGAPSDDSLNIAVTTEPREISSRHGEGPPSSDAGTIAHLDVVGSGDNAEETARQDKEGSDAWKSRFGDVTEVTQNNLGAGLANVRKIMLEFEQHEQALRESVAEVGFMTEDMEDALLDLRKKVTVAAEFEVSLHGQPRRLLILRRGPSEGGASAIPGQADMSPAEVLLLILDAVKESGEVANQAMIWPLHDAAVSAAVMGMDAKEMLKGGLLAGDSWRDRVQRTVFKILRALRITRPKDERCKVFTQHYGPGVDFMLTWTAFLIQQLWFLVPLALIWTLTGARRWHQTDERWVWEILKLLVVVWAFSLALQSTWRFPRLINGRMRMPRSRRRSGKPDTINKAYVANETWGHWCRRWAELVFLAVPSLLALLGLVICIMSGMTMLVLHIIYTWGDCIHLHSKDRPCRDAEVKYSILGWATELCCDILLAILFEVFFSCSKGVSGWVASLLNLKYASDEMLTREMIELSLATIERIGFTGSLAFLFAPQWTPPRCLGPEIDRLDLFCDCSEFAFGDSDYRCYQRRLSPETRRWVFESLMKGPFVVAPFVGILVKVLLPKALQKITRFVEGTTRSRYCCCLAPFRGILRLATLIFTYQGDGVGAFTFVRRGAPYGPIPDEEPAAPRLRAALNQVKLKLFTVEDELMEIEMSLLWVTFFMPILPIGVIFTMIAKLVEINSDVTKMLYVRRRPVPTDDRLMRREMNGYSWCVAVASCGWTAGLSLITYNNDLHEWGWKGLFIGIGMIFFLVFGSALTFTLFMHFTKLKRKVSPSDEPSANLSETSLR